MVIAESILYKLKVSVAFVSHSISARRNFFRGGEARSTKGGLVRGVAAWGVPDAGEVFKKFVKKAMKNLQFFQNFQENFAIFLKFYRIFGENLEKNLEK